MSNLLEEMPEGSLEAFIAGMRPDDQQPVHKILRYLQKNKQGDTSTTFVVYVDDQPRYLGDKVSHALKVFNIQSGKLLQAIAQAPHYPHELAFFAIAEDNSVEILGTAGINPEQSNNQPVSSTIPSDVCGLCYHPKNEASTCNRDDCPKWNRFNVCMVCYQNEDDVTACNRRDYPKWTCQGVQS